MRTAGIQIPFPQRDIWLKNPETLKSGSQLETKIETDIPQLPQQRTSSPKLFFLRDLLRQVSYFQSLNDLHLRSLIEMGCRQHLDASEIVCRQGDSGNAFYLILSGAIEAIYEQEGTEKHLFTFSESQFFGELPLMLGVPYPTTMRAVSETILFTINSQSFGQLLKSYPELAEEIVQELAKRQEVLQEHEKQIEALKLLKESQEETNPVRWLRKRLKRIFSV